MEVRVSEQSRMCAGAALGAIAGAVAAYLFFTESGRVVRDRIEPAIDDLTNEFQKFRGTIEKVGAMANDGLRALEEFQAARAQPHFPDSGLSH